MSEAVPPTWLEQWGMHLFREPIGAWLRLPGWAQVVIPIAAFIVFAGVCGLLFKGEQKVTIALLGVYLMGWLLMIAFVHRTREEPHR